MNIGGGYIAMAAAGAAEGMKMATKKTGARSAPLDPKVADKLLDLLSTDNAFRRLFKKDPQAALAQVGHPEAKAALAALKKGGTAPSLSTASCCQVASIAPKATIIKVRTQLRQMLTSGLAQNPIQLDVGTSAARRTLRGDGRRPAGQRRSNACNSSRAPRASPTCASHCARSRWAKVLMAAFHGCWQW